VFPDEEEKLVPETNDRTIVKKRKAGMKASARLKKEEKKS